MHNINIHEGDITRARVDAIVNAANPPMLGGGGVDGAIHDAAGPALLKACRAIKAVNGIRCPFGEARITGSGDLCSQYVIHTVGPIYWNEKDPKAILESAYNNSLRLALNNNCESIAFPAISCGAYGYPIRDAATISLRVCGNREFQELEIHFYLYGSEVYETWKAVYRDLST